MHIYLIWLILSMVSPVNLFSCQHPLFYIFSTASTLDNYFPEIHVKVKQVQKCFYPRDCKPMAIFFLSIPPSLPCTQKASNSSYNNKRLTSSTFPMSCLKMVTQSSHKQCSINVSVNSASCCWNRLMADLVSISNTKDLTSILLDMFRDHWYQQNICAHLSKCTSN